MIKYCRFIYGTVFITQTYNSLDRVQDNTGMLHITCDNNVSKRAPLYPNCYPIKRGITHVNIQEFTTSYTPRTEPDQSDQYTSETYIHVYLILISS
jgi:hypothetical protein